VARCADEAFRGAPRILEQILAAYVLEGRPIPAPSDADGAPTIGTRRFSLIGVEAID
jgi:hypothetical protein